MIKIRLLRIKMMETIKNIISWSSETKTGDVEVMDPRPGGWKQWRKSKKLNSLQREQWDENRVTGAGNIYF